MALAPALPQVLAVQPVLDSVKRDQAGPRAAFEQLKIGQLLTGLVKSQLKGISLVEIEGQTVAMRLPQQTAVGDRLQLRFAGNMPQTVFLLETPDSATANAPQISQTARMLSDIMQRVPERALPTLTPPGALLEQPTANPAQLAIALRTALVRSGLFYESHLANWVAGQDSLDGLMQEPQNRQAAESMRNAANTAGTARTDSATSTAFALLSPGGTADQKPVNPMHTLLSQQLQVLESPHFAWRGELWPGQLLEWEIRQKVEPEAQDSPTSMPQETEAGWESHLKLTLPQLGTLDVHIKLDAQQAFSIRMVPEQPETAPLLQQNQTRLIKQLAAAGCALNAVTVEHESDA